MGAKAPLSSSTLMLALCVTTAFTAIDVLVLMVASYRSEKKQLVWVMPHFALGLK